MTRKGNVLRRDGSPNGRLVLLMSVLKWLMTTRELPLESAADEVARCFAEEYFDEHFWAIGSGYARSLRELSSSEWTRFLPPEFGDGPAELLRSQSLGFRSTAMMDRGQLQALVNDPQTGQGPFDYDNQSPVDYWAEHAIHAITFQAAHELWGWGTPGVPEAINSYADHVAWCQVNRRAPWSVDQLRFVAAEVKARGRGGKASVARELGISAEALRQRLSGAPSSSPPLHHRRFG